MASGKSLAPSATASRRCGQGASSICIIFFRDHASKSVRNLSVTGPGPAGACTGNAPRRATLSRRWMSWPSISPPTSNTTSPTTSRRWSRHRSRSIITLVEAVARLSAMFGEHPLHDHPDRGCSCRAASAPCVTLPPSDQQDAVRDGARDIGIVDADRRGRDARADHVGRQVTPPREAYADLTRDRTMLCARGRLYRWLSRCSSASSIGSPRYDGCFGHSRPDAALCATLLKRGRLHSQMPGKRASAGFSTAAWRAEECAKPLRRGGTLARTEGARPSLS